MDQRKPKRPRSATPTKMSASDMSPPPPQKKKSKGTKSKQKKAKRNRSSSTGGGGATATAAAASGQQHAAAAAAASATMMEQPLKPPKNSMESTATADGRMMAQMLSTFSKLEQSRFEAFQRASFPADAVGKWIAACLSHRFRIVDPPQNHYHNSTTVTTNNNTTATNNTPASRSLSDLVAVDQEGEICMVVSVLAKIYAQRLVQTAIRQRAASAAAATAASQSAAGAATLSSSQQSQPQPQQPQQPAVPLLPSDILKAHEERRRLGLDPGFFLQAAQERHGLWQSDNCAAATSSGGGNNNNTNTMYQQRRLAALQAQDEYDAHMAKQQKQQDKNSSISSFKQEGKQGDNQRDYDNETKKNDDDMVIE